MPTYRNDCDEIIVTDGESFVPGEDQEVGWYVENDCLTLVSDWPPVVVPDPPADHKDSHKDGGSDDLLSAPGDIGQDTACKGAFTELKAEADPTDEHGVGDRGFNDARYAVKDLDATTVTDPGANAAVSTAIVDEYGGVIITLTGAGNAQVLQAPTDTSKTKRFVVVTDDSNGANEVEVNGITMSAGEAQRFIWEGSAWVAVTAVDADDMAFTPSGNLVATTVQTAIEELDSEKVANGDPINMEDQQLTRPEIKDYSETKTAPSSASSVLTLDIENGNVFSTLLTENVTTLNFNNPSASGKACSFTWIMTQHSSAVTVAWPASVKWDSGTAPTISENDAIYIFTFVTVDAGTTWYGFLAGSKMAVPA